MALVLYDLETTGRSRHFDQIVQFGAVRIDDALNIEAHFESRSRLLPHIVPAPTALQVIGASYADLISPLRQSHFDMILGVHQQIRKWSPAAFLGYNSIKFDEEFLRHAFYQCLLDPYVTSVGNARGDILRLARAVSQLRPDVLPHAFGPDGQRSMRLHDVATACGFRSSGAHEAMADVEAMLWIARVIAAGAPDIWSRFMQFSTKATALDFMREEDAFVAFEAEGAGRGFYLLTAFGVHPQQDARRYCLDLNCDLDAVRTSSHEELVSLFKSWTSPMRRVKANGSPLLFPLYEALEPSFPGLIEDDIMRAAASIRSDEDLVGRLNAAAFAAERVFEPAQHVEQQLYDGFFSDADKALMQQFHSVEWAQRPGIVHQFSDLRLRRLGQRIVYFEQPNLLPPTVVGDLDAAVGARWQGDQSSPWLTASGAMSELDGLDAIEVQHPGLLAYRDTLQSKLAAP